MPRRSMLRFPDEIEEALLVCALRFRGYEYQKAQGLQVPGTIAGGIEQLAIPIIETLTLHADQNNNFAAFFYLQRFLFKWGGERLTKCSREHIFLFLELYRRTPPPEYTEPEYVSRWRTEFLPRAEETAAFVRRAFQRPGKTFE